MSGSGVQIKVEKDGIKEIKIEPPDDYFDAPKLTDNVYIKEERDKKSITANASLRLLNDFVQRGIKIEDGQEGKVIASTVQKHRRSQKCEECGQKFLSERLFLAHVQWHASIVEVKIENATEQICGELRNCISETFTPKEFASTAFCDKITDGVVIKEECRNNPNRVYQKHNAALQIQYVQCKDDLTAKINALKQGQISYLKLDTANIDYYECDICQDSFPLLVMLESHMRIHTFFEIESQVEALDFSRKSKDVTKEVEVEKKPETLHKKKQAATQDWQLCECAHEDPLHVSTNETLRHMKSHNVKCEVCHKKVSVDLIERHKESHKSDMQFACVAELRKPKKRSGEKLHECNACGKLFVAIKRLKRHLRMKHGNL